MLALEMEKDAPAWLNLFFCLQDIYRKTWMTQTGQEIAAVAATNLLPSEACPAGGGRKTPLIINPKKLPFPNAVKKLFV